MSVSAPNLKKSFEESEENICRRLSAADGCTMSRRKQAKPQHIDSDEPAAVGNGKFTHETGVEHAKLAVPTTIFSPFFFGKTKFSGGSGGGGGGVPFEQRLPVAL